MSNISKKNREELLQFLDDLASKTTDTSSLLNIKKIQNALTEKQYGLIWEKHTENVDEMLVDNIPVFTEDKEKKIVSDESLPYNFLLEGDNLHSLMLLEKTHTKVDVIYIDPPYNTLKKDFKYDDKMVDENDKYPHSKWLSFMERRLKIAYKLLSKNGVMFISIDEHEYANLKLLCNDIFGEKNVETIIWSKVSDGGTAGNGKMKITYRFRTDHEYIIVCYKNKNDTLFNKPMKLPNWLTDYPNKDNDPRGNWCDGELCKSEKKSNPNGKNYYSITTPSGKTTYTRQWHCSKEEFDTYLNDTAVTDKGEIVSRIWWGANGENCPRLKKFQNMPKPTTPTSIIKDISQTVGNDDFDLIFPKEDKRKFDNPKPVILIKELLRLIPNKDAVVLDFFAGSGTTGQAVLELNQDKFDGGNRRIILCTNNENNICEDVTYQRLKIVITGIKADGTQYSDGIAANLKYFKTDFVERNSERVPDELAEHCSEMIEIQKAINVEEYNNHNAQFLLLKNDDEADYLFDNFDKYSVLKEIYIIEDTNEDDSVILTNAQIEKFSKIKIIPIPRWYFENEIRGII